MISDNFELERPHHFEVDEVASVNNGGAYSLLHDNHDDGTICNGSNKSSTRKTETQSDPHYLVSPYDNDDDNENAIKYQDSADNSAEDKTIIINEGEKKNYDTKLLISFLLMVILGTGCTIFQKLQTIPMVNYPNTLNLLANFVYVPFCFAYILPVSKYGLFDNAIPSDMTTMNKRPFVIMGLLDCISNTLFTFSAVYLPGSLLILLPQAAIPISMAFSKRIMGERYRMYQYFGALVVILGILVVLEPLITSRHAADHVCRAIDEEEYCALCGEESSEKGCLSHRTKIDANSMEFGLGGLGDSSESSTTENDDGALCRWVSSDSDSSSSSVESTTSLLLWSVMLILACIPMTLSSIYKEMALSGDSNNSNISINIDPMFLNGWVAWYQLLFSFPLAIPAGMATGVMPAEVPKNIWDGLKCYIGSGTIETGCHPDDQCHESLFYVNMFLVFNCGISILIVYILKFGSANVLFMAATVMVPIGNLAFALPFMPGSQPLRDSDIAGLLVILFGLVVYRFGDGIKCNLHLCKNFHTTSFMPWRIGKKIRHSSMQNSNSSALFDDENNYHEVDLSASSSRLDDHLLSPIN